MTNAEFIKRLCEMPEAKLNAYAASDKFTLDVGMRVAAITKNKAVRERVLNHGLNEEQIAERKAKRVKEMAELEVRLNTYINDEPLQNEDGTFNFNNKE